MVDQPFKLIEAFRVFLRVIHPQRPELADEVTGIDCFLHPKRHGIPPVELDALKMARACLNKYVREGRIRLLGILEGTEYPQEPHKIPPMDCTAGELNIWEDALEILLVPEKRWNVYRQVHAVAADVRAVAAAFAMTHVDRSPVEVFRTGAPGRPSSIQLVELEHRARWDRGEALTSIVQESKVLSEWLKNTHPNAPRLQSKTIRNTLAEQHQQQIAARK